MLSFAQRLWFLDRLDPGKLTYSIPTGVLDRPLNLAALTAASAKSEASRSLANALHTGRWATDSSVRSAYYHPTRDRPAAEREQKARRLAIEEAERPFDLAQAAATGHSAATGRGRACIAVDDAPHRIRPWSMGTTGTGSAL